MIVYLLMNYYL